jgi:hypothetical protein
MSAVALDDVSGGDVPRPCRRHFIVPDLPPMGQELLVVEYRAFFVCLPSFVFAGPAVVAARRLHETQSL